MDGWMDGWMDGRTDRQTNMQANRQTDRQTSRHTNRQTGRWIDRQYRQTDGLIAPSLDTVKSQIKTYHLTPSVNFLTRVEPTVFLPRSCYGTTEVALLLLLLLQLLLLSLWLS